MKTHDPKKFLEDFRDHLARHDRPLTFLFGAGTSSSVNVAPEPKPGEKRKYVPLIPAVAPLTLLCKEASIKLGVPYGVAWDLLMTECKAVILEPNVETILSAVRHKINAVGETDVLVGLDKNGLAKLEECIKSTIAEAVLPEDKLFPAKLPHDLLARWIKDASRHLPIEIFTTNYDILIERSLELARVPVFDGFVGCYQPFFVPDCVERNELLPGREWVRLWKVHGSVNWKLVTNGSSQRLVRTSPSKTGEMILPSHRKYDESRKEPYLTLLARLGKTLQQDDALLVTSGYSFGDEHINSVLFSALDNSPRSHILSLQYDEIKKTDKIVAYAKAHKKMLLVGPNAAVISGDWAEWQMNEPVDDSTAEFIDPAFDSFGEPEDVSLSCRGIMRLGDFNWFCKFLGTINSKDPFSNE